jgi:hypothetical protein
MSPTRTGEPLPAHSSVDLSEAVQSPDRRGGCHREYAVQALAMDDRFGVALGLNADPVPHRNTVLHIKVKCLRGGQSSRMLAANQSSF